MLSDFAALRVCLHSFTTCYFTLSCFAAELAPTQEINPNIFVVQYINNRAEPKSVKMFRLPGKGRVIHVGNTCVDVGD